MHSNHTAVTAADSVINLPKNLLKTKVSQVEKVAPGSRKAVTAYPVELSVLIDRIRVGGPDRSIIEAIRETTSLETYRTLKTRLGGFYLSAVYEGSVVGVEGFRCHTQFLLADFDYLTEALEGPRFTAFRGEKPEEQERRQKRSDRVVKAAGMLQAKGFTFFDDILEALRTDPYVFLLMLSTGGTGLKAGVRIPITTTGNLESATCDHQASFRALTRYFLDRFGLEMDAQCCNVNRVSFHTFDPDVYFNAGAKVFLDKELPRRTDLPVGNEIVDPRLELTIRRIEELRCDITSDYSDWVRIGMALATLGESGRSLYHRVSRFYPGYTHEECERKFDNLLATRKSRGGGEITLATFYFLCRQFGIHAGPTGSSNNVLTVTRTNAGEIIPGREENKERAQAARYDRFEQVLWQCIDRQFAIRYNEFNGRIEYQAIGSAAPWQPITDQVVSSLSNELHRLGVSFHREWLRDYLGDPANFERDNPVRRYFEQLRTYQSAGQVDNFFSSFRGLVNADRIVPVALKAFAQVAASALELEPDGIKAELCLAMISPIGRGKTRLLTKTLARGFIDYVSEDLPDDDYQLDLEMSSCLMIIDDENKNFSRRDAAKIKSLLSRTRIRRVLKYDKYGSSFARRAVLFLTSNNRQILSDLTGNRRFVPFEFDDLDWDVVNTLDVDGFWAEIVRLLLAEGESAYRLTEKEEMASLSRLSEDYQRGSDLEATMTALFRPSPTHSLPGGSARDLSHHYSTFKPFFLSLTDTMMVLQRSYGIRSHGRLTSEIKSFLEEKWNLRTVRLRLDASGRYLPHARPAYWLEVIDEPTRFLLCGAESMAKEKSKTYYADPDCVCDG